MKQCIICGEVKSNWKMFNLSYITQKYRALNKKPICKKCSARLLDRLIESIVDNYESTIPEGNLKECVEQHSKDQIIK